MRKKEPSAYSRNLISKLHQLIGGGEFARGTLNTRMLTCGKDNCRCKRGERHRTLYLVISVEGTIRQIYIPRVMEKEVTGMVERYKKIKALIEKLSEDTVTKIIERKE